MPPSLTLGGVIFLLFKAYIGGNLNLKGVYDIIFKYGGFALIGAYTGGNFISMPRYVSLFYTKIVRYLRHMWGSID